MEVYKPGTKVSLDEKTEATIVTVALHVGDYVQYECAWWSGGARTREWFHEDEILEIVDTSKPKVQIGFHNTDT